MILNFKNFIAEAKLNISDLISPRLLKELKSLVDSNIANQLISGSHYNDIDMAVMVNVVRLVLNYYSYDKSVFNSLVFALSKLDKDKLNSIRFENYTIKTLYTYLNKDAIKIKKSKINLNNPIIIKTVNSLIKNKIIPSDSNETILQDTAFLFLVKLLYNNLEYLENFYILYRVNNKSLNDLSNLAKNLSFDMLNNSEVETVNKFDKLSFSRNAYRLGNFRDEEINDFCQELYLNNFVTYSIDSIYIDLKKELLKSDFKDRLIGYVGQVIQGYIADKETNFFKINSDDLKAILTIIDNDLFDKLKTIRFNPDHTERSINDQATAYTNLINSKTNYILDKKDLFRVIAKNSLKEGVDFYIIRNEEAEPNFIILQNISFKANRILCAETKFCTATYENLSKQYSEENFDYIIFDFSRRFIDKFRVSSITISPALGNPSITILDKYDKSQIVNDAIVKAGLSIDYLINIRDYDKLKTLDVNALIGYNEPLEIVYKFFDKYPSKINLYGQIANRIIGSNSKIIMKYLHDLSLLKSKSDDKYFKLLIDMHLKNRSEFYTLIENNISLELIINKVVTENNYIGKYPNIYYFIEFKKEISRGLLEYNISDLVNYIITNHLTSISFSIIESDGSIVNVNDFGLSNFFNKYLVKASQLEDFINYFKYVVDNKLIDSAITLYPNNLLSIIDTDTSFKDYLIKNVYSIDSVKLFKLPFSNSHYEISKNIVFVQFFNREFSEDFKNMVFDIEGLIINFFNTENTKLLLALTPSTELEKLFISIVSKYSDRDPREKVLTFLRANHFQLYTIAINVIYKTNVFSLKTNDLHNLPKNVAISYEGLKGNVENIKKLYFEIKTELLKKILSELTMDQIIEIAESVQLDARLIDAIYTKLNMPHVDFWEAYRFFSWISKEATIGRVFPKQKLNTLFEKFFVGPLSKYYLRKVVHYKSLFDMMSDEIFNDCIVANIVINVNSFYQLFIDQKYLSKIKNIISTNSIRYPYEIDSYFHKYFEIILLFDISYQRQAVKKSGTDLNKSFRDLPVLLLKDNVFLNNIIGLGIHEQFISALSISGYPFKDILYAVGTIHDTTGFINLNFIKELYKQFPEYELFNKYFPDSILKNLYAKYFDDTYVGITANQSTLGNLLTPEQKSKLGIKENKYILKYNDFLNEGVFDVTPSEFTFTKDYDGDYEYKGTVNGETYHIEFEFEKFKKMNFVTLSFYSSESPRDEDGYVEYKPLKNKKNIFGFIKLLKSVINDFIDRTKFTSSKNEYFVFFTDHSYLNKLYSMILTKIFDKNYVTYSTGFSVYGQVNDISIVYNKSINTMNDDQFENIIGSTKYGILRDFFDEWFEAEDFYPKYDEQEIFIKLRDEYISISDIKALNEF